MPGPTDHLWGIILAGGEGKRLQSFIRSRFGSDRPKQYCTLFGNRSMLGHTLARADRIIPPERLLTVVTHPHRQYAHEELYDRPPGTVIVQPSNRETGPGILLPLLHVYQRDPKAIVVLLPADHFIAEEERFMSYVEEAAALVATSPGCLVLLGVEPKRPEPEYGWIETGGISGHHDHMEVHRVRRFWEKPNRRTAKILYRRYDCLWNTMVVVGRAWWLLSLFKTLTPEISVLFDDLQPHLGSPREAEVVEKIYTRLQAVDFSRAILAQHPPRLTAVRVKDVHWSDWGNPAQVELDLAHSDFWSKSASGLKVGLATQTIHTEVCRRT